MTENLKDNMQDILSNIRDVISGNNEEVIELVQEVDKDGKPLKPLDVLQKIDDTLGKADNQSEVLPESQPVPSEDILKQDALKNETSISEQTKVTGSQEVTKNPENLVVPNDKGEMQNEKNKEKIYNDQVNQDLERDQLTKGLLSEQAIEESSKHFKELLKAVARPQDNFGLRSGVTVEDLVVEALKPQLSSWLDKNLPILVKELVEKEIKRLIPDNE